MNASSRKHWPLISTVGLYWVIVAGLLLLSTCGTQGRLVYPLDDSYIHMAIAKNMALHHVWGVSRYEFASSTSSPLWTFLLAITYVAFGPNDISPLALNILFGTLLLLASYLFFAKYMTGRVRVFVCLLLVLLATPLPPLTLAGMEHVLQALLALCFVWVAVAAVSPATRPSYRHEVLLLALAPLVTMVRYEGIFLVGVVCIVVALRRGFALAVILAAVALCPVIAYGVWSMAHGWSFLPNSVILKGQVPDFSVREIIKLFGYDSLKAIQETPHILLLLGASLLVLLFLSLKSEKSHEGKRCANWIFVGAAFFHMQFAATGWFYRYEAYLVLLGIAVISTAADDLLPKTYGSRIAREKRLDYVTVMLLMAVAVSPFVFRSLDSLRETPTATKNIYEQQYQMGLFLRRFYDGRTVAVNDMGAVSYLADIRLLDLWGIGSREPASLRRHNQYNTQRIYDLAKERNAAIAIVYDLWFAGPQIGGLPSQWVKRGEWTISNNVICSDNTVSLYAIDPSASDELTGNLRDFAGELPPDVRQGGEYLQQAARTATQAPESVRSAPVNPRVDRR
ncbi:MAG TPA: hypothetical protein VMZ31_00455 [Phycisphaerae bacterium]|nr:hypothetical protein [Phycisphaerae bacterium]